MNFNRKRIPIVFLIFFLFFNGIGFAFAMEKQVGTMDKENFSIDVNGKLLGDIVNVIEKKTGYRVKANQDLLDTPVVGVFRNISLIDFFNRILKGKNIFLLEDTKEKEIIIQTCLSGEDEITVDSRHGDDHKNREHFVNLISSQRLLSDSIVDNGDRVEACPGVSYRQLVKYQRQLDQKIFDKDSGVNAACGVVYHNLSRSQEALDNYIVTKESEVEASPGLSYRALVAIQAKLDEQLQARKR